MATATGEDVPGARHQLTDRLRAAVLGPRGGGTTRRRASDAFRLGLAVVVVAVSIPVMRANSAAELSIVRAVHPPPAAISWLVTLVFWLGSAGVSVLLVVVGLLVPRLTAVRRAAVAAVLTWGVCVLLGVLLGPAAGRPPVSELAGLNAGYPVTQIAVAIAVAATALPYLSRPVHRLVWFLVAVAVLAAVCGGEALPVNAISSVALGWGLAAGLHLAVGSPLGLPSAAEVTEWIADLRVAVADIARAPRQVWGVEQFMMTCPAGAGQAGPMSDSLSGLVNRIITWADRLQRQHGVLGFPYAVVKKYGDDEGGRQAALITYYGFLSIFPLLLLGVAVLSRVLADHPDLRRRLIAAIVPPTLRPTIEHSLATLPASTIPFVAGLIGLLFSGTGVVFSVYQTLNHVAAVRHRCRASFVSRYVRVFVVLATLMIGALAVGVLTVVATALPGQPAVQRAAAVLGSALVVFAVLLLGAKVLLARPAPVRALWPGAIVGAAAVTVVLNVGAPLLARLVTKAGPVYGSFATVAGIFALLYLVGRALVYAAEVAAVRYARLWPRALDLTRPTAADARALALLAREQERIPAARIQFRLAAPGSPPVPGGSPPASDGPG